VWRCEFALSFQTGRQSAVFAGYCQEDCFLGTRLLCVTLSIRSSAIAAEGPRARRVVSVNIVRNVAQICVELRVISPATGGDLRHQKNRVPGLLCGTVDVMLRLSVFAEHRLVTDRHRHRAIAYTALA